MTPPTPTDLAEAIVRLLRPGSDDFAEDTRKVAALIEEWERELLGKLKLLEANQPFYQELADEYEQILPPHKHNGSKGDWLNRTKQLRIERDQLQQEVERLQSRACI